MIIFIQGNNIKKTEELLKKYKIQGYRNFYGDLDDLKVAINTNQNLFKQSHTKILINLDINKQLRVIKELADILKSPLAKKKEIILTSKEINLKDFIKKYNLESFATLKEISNDKNNEIFTFIDMLFYGNIEKTLEIMENLLKNFSGGYLLSMIFSSVRNVLYFKFDKKKFKTLHPFVQQKTISLNNKISKKSLYNVIIAIKEADYKLKSNIDEKSIIIGLALYIKENLNK